MEPDSVEAHTTPTGVFIGLTTFDLIHYVDHFPGADEKVQAMACWTGAGGPAANAAATFAALGGHATLLTAIGNGPTADAARKDLNDLKVKTIDLATTGGLPTSSVAVDRSGQRTVVSMNALGFDQEGMISRVPIIDPCDVVVFDSHYPTVVDATLNSLPVPAPPTVFDPGGPKPHVFDLMKRGDHVIASRSLDPNASVDQLLEQVDKHSVVMAAVTAGSEPLSAKIDGEKVELPVSKVTAQDTLGAGDVLHGAYAYFLATGCAARDSLAQAVDVAARSCERHGPRLDS